MTLADSRSKLSDLNVVSSKYRRRGCNSQWLKSIIFFLQGVLKGKASPWQVFYRVRNFRGLFPAKVLFKIMLRQHIARFVSLSLVICGSFYNNEIYMAYWLIVECNQISMLRATYCCAHMLLPFDYDLVWLAKEMFNYTSAWANLDAFPLLSAEYCHILFKLSASAACCDIDLYCFMRSQCYTPNVVSPFA